MNLKKRNKKKIKLLILVGKLDARIKSLFANQFEQERKKKLKDMDRIRDLIMQMQSTVCEIRVIRAYGLRLSEIAFLKPKRKYAPIFDERIFTEKLLGRPSPGLPPPSLAVSFC